MLLYQDSRFREIPFALDFASCEITDESDELLIYQHFSFVSTGTYCFVNIQQCKDKRYNFDNKL